jgi:ankyrin repeat protein
MVEMLLASGASVDAKDSAGCTPLHLAAKYGHTEIVDMLLAAGADARARQHDGLTALHYAATHYRDQIAAVVFQALLAVGVDPQAASSCGVRPIHCAAAAHNAQILASLLMAGVSTDIACSDGWAPLHFAAAGYYSRARVVAGLLAAGAPIDAECGAAGPILRQTMLSLGLGKVCDHEGATPLQLAAAGGNQHIVACLLAAGASVTLAASGDGRTALHWAAAWGCPECVIALLAAGADAAATSSNGDTPLHSAAAPRRDNTEECIAALLAAGADASAVNSQGQLPLQVAGRMSLRAGVMLRQAAACPIRQCVLRRAASSIRSGDRAARAAELQAAAQELVVAGAPGKHVCCALCLCFPQREICSCTLR